MLQTKNIEALTRTSFVAPAPQAYNAPKIAMPKHDLTENIIKEHSNNTINDSRGGNLMADKPNEPANGLSSGLAISSAASGSAGNRALDQALVERAQQGDKKAFGMLVEKYHRKLGRLLGRMIRDQAEVEDVVQESFIKAYRALHNFRGDSAFYTWLYRIGINTAKNYLVSMGRRPQVMQEVEIEDVENFDDGGEMRTMDTPETAMMTKQIAQTVNDTVASLPEELRTAITLREIEGLSYEEIATLMQCPIGTVRSRIFRARETISEKLRPLVDAKEGKRW